MTLNFCLYFYMDIGCKRILQISQTRDHGKQFATKQHWNFHLATLCKAGSNCGERIKLSFINIQIFHHTKLLLLGPIGLIVWLFAYFSASIINIRSISVCSYIHLFSWQISKSRKMLLWKFTENNGRLWLSAVSFHSRYNLRLKTWSGIGLCSRSASGLISQTCF